MTPNDLDDALRQAGFSGVTRLDDTVFARTDATAAEFQALRDGEQWILSFASPVRARARDLTAWNAVYPKAPLDLFQGETRVSMRLIQASDLTEWRAIVAAMLAKSLLWRRAQRQGDEGM